MFYVNNGDGDLKMFPTKKNNVLMKSTNLWLENFADNIHATTIDDEIEVLCMA